MSGYSGLGLAQFFGKTQPQCYVVDGLPLWFKLTKNTSFLDRMIKSFALSVWVIASVRAREICQYGMM